MALDGLSRKVGAIALAGVALSIATPARALPGQSLARFETWAHEHRVLAGITRTRDELSGFPEYTLSTADHGIAWSFIAKSDGSTVQTELLGVGDVGKTPGTAPIRHDGSGYGFVFFRSLYGADVAADFLASKPVAVFSEALARDVTAYYRGRRFGYVLANGFVTIATPAALATQLALVRRCLAHPHACSE